MSFSSLSPSSLSLPDRSVKGWWWWVLPLLAGVLPWLIAVRFTCEVPRADHWFVVADPYLRWAQDGDFMTFLHHPGNDSRHDAPRVLHWLIVRFADWSFVLESLVCVWLGIASAWMTLSLWKRHPAAFWVKWPLAVLSTLLLLSPMQWMNWAWGVQICYMLVVLCTLGVIWVFERSWMLWLRTVVAGALATVAVFSFINGWLAWMLGGVLILKEIVERRGRTKQGWAAMVLWGAMFAAVLAVFISGWPENKELSGADSKFSMQEVKELGMFFIHLLGAPFAEGWPTLDRDLRGQLIFGIATVLGFASLGMLGLALWRLWAERAKLTLAVVTPWLLICGWGLANALAITLARVGKAGFLPFQSRYPSFTLWFFIGMLGLLALSKTGWVRWVTRGWVVILLWGWGVGAIQGWRDGIKMSHSSHLLEAGVTMRHAALEPSLIDGIDPGAGEAIIPALDKLEELGLLHVKTLAGALVSQASVEAEGKFPGELEEGKLEDGGVRLEGWAMDPQSHDAVKAVAISIENGGQPERWLGIATRRSKKVKIAKKLKAEALEDRIGWIYVPMTGEETSGFSPQKLNLKRQPLPSGTAVFRAYAMDPKTGQFFPLQGSVTLQLP